ncbi:hypothetical protein Noda2021_07870 [Candidatus Dependentiae bacterium Noda2021]|nr:hypothetical protein Noda2021_07870 [Candidatus Dependentiae bacterium Noda2021]
MSMVLHPKKLLLLFFVICLPAMQIKPMEQNPVVETYKLISTVSNAAQETKKFYIKINHKIATASVIGICLASGVGSGAAAFLLLKSYGAALLYGAISGQCAMAYQLLAKKFDKGFNELKDKIDLLSVHIDDNHQEMMQKVLQGNNNIETNNLKITELSHLVNANFKIHGDQLAFAIDELKALQDSQVTPEQLENKLQLLQKKLSDEIESYSNKLDQRDEKKHARLLKRVVKTAKKINPDVHEADIVTMYNECSAEQLREIIEDQKAELKKIENDALNNLLDGVNSNLERHERLINVQGSTIMKMSNALDEVQQRLSSIEDKAEAQDAKLSEIIFTSKETADGVKLLVLASNTNIEEKRKKAEKQQRVSTEQPAKTPIFSHPYNPYKPAVANPTVWPKQLKHDSKS